MPGVLTRAAPDVPFVAPSPARITEPALRDTPPLGVYQVPAQAQGACRSEFPLRDDLGAERVLPCQEVLTGSAHQMKSRERRGQRHQETTMPKNLLHDEYTPRELAGGRS
jgi:hypothetical protein